MGETGAGEVVREGEWVVVINEAGESELALAKLDGFLLLNSVPCLTRGLVGVPYGTCFDMVAMDSQGKCDALSSASFVSRYGEKFEKSLIVKRSKRQAKKEAKNERKRARKADGAATSALDETDDRAAKDGDCPPANGDAVSAAAAAEDEEAEAEEEEERDDLPYFDLVRLEAGRVGVYQSSVEELAQQRQELLERLEMLERDLGIPCVRANSASGSDSTDAFGGAEQKSNKHITQSASNQKLGPEEIKAMVDGGMETSELVGRLAENSATFAERPEYSKEKYKEKKTRKFSRKVRVVRATAQTIGETMWAEELGTSFKIGTFRPFDTLPQVMGLGNVQAGSHVLVLESMAGLVLGSVLERLGNTGKVFAGFVNQEDDEKMLEFFNLGERTNALVERVDLAALVEGRRGDEYGVMLACKQRLLEYQLGWHTSKLEAEQDEPRKAALAAEIEVMRSVKSSLQKKGRGREAEMIQRCAQFTSLRENGCDSLIITSKYDPSRALAALLPFLAPGRPFVVYSESLDCLVQARLQTQDLAHNVRLSETWLRAHQVLPGRTHPAMSMSGRGGYLLSGTRIIPVPKEQQQRIFVREKGRGKPASSA